MYEYKPIAESNSFIVLEKYTKEWETAESYQSEGDLEREFIQDLVNQGYENPRGLNTPEALLANVREQLQTLNHVQFSDGEWSRFVETWLDRPSDSIVDKTRKIHDDYIRDFVFDDGRIQNIYLLDKRNLSRNKVQVIKQFEQTGSHANRYDVTVLVNGLPLVQVELKKRGVAIREAFNQVHRYSKESFNSEQSLYKYLQLFVISNGTDTRPSHAISQRQRQDRSSRQSEPFLLGTAPREDRRTDRARRAPWRPHTGRPARSCLAHGAPSPLPPGPRLGATPSESPARCNIQHMVCTSFWHPDGTPMSAQQFMEMLFGKLPEFFKDEDELRALWSAPDTRKKLLQGLAEKGFGHEQLGEMQKIINAEKSDLFDVLAYVAYALPPLNREERAARAKVVISTHFNSKQQAFLDFVLAHYIQVGVEELDQEKLTPLLRHKYHNSISDALADLGPPEDISVRQTPA